MRGQHQEGGGMNNNEAKKVILEADSCFCKHGAYKDCLSGCKYREALDASVKALEQEPTTKNNLGVENDLVGSIVETISEKVTETHEEFIFESIRPYCENVVQMKISKRDLEQALLKYYGKNDLGVDWDELKRKILMEVDGGTDDKWLRYADVCDNISDSIDDFKTNLPSVTPQEPKTGEWIKQNDDYFDWYECSECGYGSEGEMQYSSEYDVRTNYCPNCGAKMEVEDNG